MPHILEGKAYDRNAALHTLSKSVCGSGPKIKFPIVYTHRKHACG